jgi:hypothetical protein
MGLESFSRAKAGGMEAHHRPPRHQQAILEALYENGDAKEATVHRQVQRPLRLLRPKGRLLLPFDSPEGPRGGHSEFGRTFVMALRSTYKMEHVPLYVSEVHGRVREQAPEFRGDCSPKPISKHIRKGEKEVALLTTHAHGPSCQKRYFPVARFLGYSHFPILYIRTGGSGGAKSPRKIEGSGGRSPPENF